MLSKVFKHQFPALIFCLLAATAPQALANGIPVQCAGCVDATQRAAVTTANSVGEYIEAQTKALELVLEYIMNTQEYNAGMRERFIADTEDFKRTERALGMGAKPFGACAEYEATATSVQRRIAERAAGSLFSQGSRDRTRQSRHLPPGEPRMQKNVDDLIEIFEDPAQRHSPVSDYVFSDRPVDADSVQSFMRNLLLLLNPFPVVTPSEDEISEIRLRGTTGEREALAQAIALQQRQEVAMKAVTLGAERNIQTLKPQAMRGLLEMAKPYLVEDPLRPDGTLPPSQWDKDLSPNQLDELLYTYRTISPEWYTAIMTADSEFVLLREQTAMQSMMLQSMWEIRKLLQKQLSLAGFSEIREASQAGLMSR